MAGLPQTHHTNTGQPVTVDRADLAGSGLED
jgi:hypothetical protein